MNLLALFRRKPATELKIVVKNREPTTLRSHEWRSDKDLTSSALKLMGNPDFRMMLQVCENDHPAFNVLRDDVPLDARAIYQARCEGYTMALANLRSLAKFQAPPEPLEETFESQD